MKRLTRVFVTVALATAAQIGTDAANVTVTIDYTRPKQPLDGFGASITWGANNLSATEDHAPLGAIGVATGTCTITVPAKSIVTRARVRFDSPRRAAARSTAVVTRAVSSACAGARPGMSVLSFRANKITAFAHQQAPAQVLAPINGMLESQALVHRNTRRSCTRREALEEPPTGRRARSADAARGGCGAGTSQWCRTAIVTGGREILVRLV
jgi:hypothetical protein